MKVYTDYGNGKVKTLDRCLFVIEDTSEWTMIAVALNKMLEDERHILEGLSKDYPELCPAIERRISILEKIIAQQEPMNTIPMEQFDIKQIKNELWRKFYDAAG